MSTLTSTDTVREFYDAWQRWDDDAMLALLDPAFTIEQAIGTPWDGVFRGTREGLRCLWRCRQTLHVVLTPTTVIETGASVAVTGSATGLFRATGSAFATAYVHLWQVRGGRITRLAVLFDEAAVQAALHAEPPALLAA